MRSGKHTGCVVWLTGLSGAGKSTLGAALAAHLRAADQNVEILDGDSVREHLSQELGFSREDRDINIRRIAFVAKLLARNGVIVIVAAISPYRAARDEARAQTDHFLEVHVQCSIDELVRRDTKGLYARALAGSLPNFTGISDPYEEPLAPEVTVRTDMEPLEASVSSVLAALELRGLHVAPARTPNA
ncbi:MAG: adenylyl-sulfate kinase [Chloroflexota bacterium]